ncbi:uncharacterized protein LOC132513879 isoform X2 [Lagenorhynchus albirostris]|uniref:uncharacterized protein LOC132513879 isoform X2 n=1 Tax=Lagenorhynchus albirostris TaxID=27610 RepID=UPI0028E57857|nr:uncharacterized protein LOC132513879 isoform X2 [Lagenorhynchus albirostris]
MSSLERAAGEARAAPAGRRPGEDQEVWEGGSAAAAHGPRPLIPGGHALLMRIRWLFSRLAPADRILCSLFRSSSTSRRRLKPSVGVTEVRSYLKLPCIHLRKKVPPGQWCVEGDLNSLVKISVPSKCPSDRYLGASRRPSLVRTQRKSKNEEVGVQALKYVLFPKGVWLGLLYRVLLDCRGLCSTSGQGPRAEVPGPAFSH